ncbi:TonB-dependent receptor plug domain-containing protein [Pseudotabrizicola alkalilacus]|uniref:TonB-dependent receptor n=1 Tax=Pseudotabrizicola alkalilacus TaxID=2305252 RepID=A0A411Z0P6_9RHOB|nr:TonB-dependent receptor [Pseudotabrizicola alkalilacus]RGP36608.1 TonB-dependent receptor [Pseudotabrizicola alkalilacus]
MTRFNSAGARGLLCASVSLFALPALAQDISLDPILVAQQDEQAGAADRATTQYVSQAELERARTGDLKDLFAGIASVSVGGAMPIAQKIFVNGVDMLNLRVTLDGVAQNNRAFHHVSANAIDPGLLKAARADAGVAAADAGPHAMAGSVVFETVDAGDILADGQNIGGNLRLSYADNGKTLTGALTAAGRHEGFEWLGYLKSAQGDDYQAGAGNTIQGSRADLQSGLVKLAYESDQGDRIEFSAQQLRDKALRPYRANFGGTIGGRPTPATRVYDTTRTSVSLSYENTQATGLWDPKLVIGFSESEVNVPDPYSSEGTSGTTSLTLQNTFNLSERDTVTVGLDAYRRNGLYEGPGLRLEEKSRNIGVFAQARLEPVERLKLSFGLRADRQTFTGVTGWQDTNSGLSGNASVSYGVTDALTLRAGVSSVFGGIDIEDNYTFDRAPRPLWSYATLKPSRSENIVAGVDWTDGRLTLGGEVFQTKIDNARGAEDNFDFESRGFNLGGTYGWGGGFARLTYSNSKVTVNGTASSSYDAQDFGAPLGQVLAFEVQQEVGASGWTLGGSLDVAFDYNTVPADAQNSLKGYEVVNVFAEYVPPRMQNLRLRAEVTNLFDTDFADRATYGADFNTVIPLREPGRTVTLSLVSKF